jgi:alanine racemase
MQTTLPPSIRPAWVEIDLKQLEKNFVIINNDRPAHLKILSVIKDQAYGHGAVEVAEMAKKSGVSYFGAVTVDEALELRNAGLTDPILLFGERTSEELELCAVYKFTPCINDPVKAKIFADFSRKSRTSCKIHIEIDSGMSRYGMRWEHALATIDMISRIDGLQIEGLMTHFAMSDESDKSFAMLQLERYQQVVKQVSELDLKIEYLHTSNTGGFLDLPMAHLNMVRMGILPLGVYPSKVCRRIEGLKPVMSVKSKLSAIRTLHPDDKVGYGMRYTADSERRIAVVPIGYGDGYPRVRNQGQMLVGGKRAPIVGGNAMDATMIDITDIPQARLWDEVVLMGDQGNESISVHEIAETKGSVSYDILTGWRSRLPRIYVRGTGHV